MEETGKEENSLHCLVCVCVCILQREFCVVSGWVRQSVGLRSLALCSALSRCALLSAEWKHHVSVGRPEEQPCFSRLRPEQAVKDGPRRKKVQHGLEEKLGVDCRERKPERSKFRG